MKQVKIENLLNKEMLRFVKDHDNGSNNFEKIELAAMYMAAGYATASGIASVANKVATKVATKVEEKNVNVDDDSSKSSSNMQEVADAMSATKDVLRKDVVLYATIAGVAGIAGCLCRDLRKMAKK